MERDPREIHDQIIDHDLVGKDERTLLSLVLIELRRLRRDISDHYNRDADVGRGG